AELGGYLGQGTDAGAVNAIVVRDQDSHARSRCKGTARFLNPPLIGALMDVVLFYSQAAGDGVGLARLRQAVTGAGHKLVHVVERHHDPESLLDVPADLVVAAGGDGTVGAAARALAGRGVPLGV